jgi:hypothetical protein
MFERFKEMDYDTVITYDELDNCLREGSIRDKKRYVFERFKKEMLLQQQKCLENMANKGYRICQPNEHVRLTNKEMKSAERRARKAVNIILNTNMSKLTAREQAIATLSAARVQPLLATIIGEQKALQIEQKDYKLPSVPRK